MFGLTVRRLNTNKPYTMEELYEAIKDQKFDAGKPEYYKDGIIQLIIFPPLDKFNQVRIAPAELKKGSFSKFKIKKSREVGIVNRVEYRVMKKGSHGLVGIFNFAGKNTRRAEEQVKSIYEVLQALGL